MATEDIIIRLVLSAILGGLIGAERELRNKSAGFRTLILISLGSCLFTIVSVLIDVNSQDRIASTIVTGIGFLGAGVIFKSNYGVKGLTTAATIWVTAAIGMAVGGGYFIASIITAILVLIVLYVLGYFQKLLEKANEEITYRVIFENDLEIANRVEEFMLKHKLRFKRTRQIKKDEQVLIYWHVRGDRKDQHHLVEMLLRDQQIRRFDYSDKQLG
jgi:putative Mg2+ transporter-C (MgtC) family protein